MHEMKKLRNYLQLQNMLSVPLYANRMNPQVDTRFHSHDFIELVLIRHGTGLHLLNSRKHSLRRGDILMIPCGFSHAYHECSDDLALDNILYRPEFLMVERKDLTLLPGGRLLCNAKPKISEDQLIAHCNEEQFVQLEHLVDELLREYQKRAPGYLFMIQSVFSVILGHCARLFNPDQTSDRMHFFNAEKTVSYINRHFRESLNIPQLCRIAGLSRPMLQKAFFQITGTSPIQYQLHLKIAEAVMLLKSTDKDMAEIAFTLGFSDSNYFGRQFKRIMGISPARYRSTADAKKCSDKINLPPSEKPSPV